jgi:chorismate synthase
MDTWVAGHLRSLGPFEIDITPSFEEILCSRNSPVRACRKDIEKIYEEMIMQAMKEGDSYGGVVEVTARNPPAGLGEPVFDKIKADLAKAIMSIPAVVGFEYGLGFKASRMRGSEASDEIVMRDGRLRWRYNYSGGILGGITTGEDIVIRCAFKPTSSIRKPQKTIDLRTMQETLISVTGRHDPAVAIRGVSVVESMVALVIADHAIRSGVINPVKLSPDDADKIEEGWRRYRKACGPSQESQ